MLERLVDQELAIQKAQDQKLDRDPRVIQQLESTRREIIARAYVEKIAGGAPKPSPAEMKAYYDTHPALFKDRRVYSLQEISIEATPEQIPVLQAQLNAAKTVPDFANFLKSNNYKFSANSVTRAAEQLPLASLDKFAAMKDGQTAFNAVGKGVVEEYKKLEGKGLYAGVGFEQREGILVLRGYVEVAFNRGQLRVHIGRCRLGHLIAPHSGLGRVAQYVQHVLNGRNAGSPTHCALICSDLVDGALLAPAGFVPSRHSPPF